MRGDLRENQQTHKQAHKAWDAEARTPFPMVQRGASGLPLASQPPQPAAGNGAGPHLVIPPSQGALCALLPPGASQRLGAWCLG